MDIKRITKTAIFMAIITVTKIVIDIPIPGTKGYINASEVAIFLTVLILNHKSSSLTAGLACAGADILLGYAFYAPITFFVKAIEALLAHNLLKVKKLPVFASLALASVINPLGYFLAEIFMYGKQTALIGIPANIGQSLFGALVATIVYPLIIKAIEASNK